MKRSKVSRNSQCPCGSGLKHKKCCLAAGNPYYCHTLTPIDRFKIVMWHQGHEFSDKVAFVFENDECVDMFPYNPENIIKL